MMRISLRVSECRGGCQQPLDSPGDSAGKIRISGSVTWSVHATFYRFISNVKLYPDFDPMSPALHSTDLRRLAGDETI